MSDDEYIVLDLETTGLSKYRHRITEIAAVKLRDGKIVNKYQTLVNPKTSIPRFITHLTGITDEMVKDADPIEKVLPEFMKFLGKSMIVAHNATFDYGFLYVNSKAHLNIELENERICTRKLANRLLPDLQSKRLASLCKHFEIENVSEHRAMGDTEATTKIFLEFKDMMHEKKIKSKEQIKKFEKSAIKREKHVMSIQD